MSAAPYSALVIEHFERPRNSGRLAPGVDVISASAGAPAQGAKFSLSARIGAGRITAARFEAYGCPHCIAAGSWLTGQLEGCTLPQLEAWAWPQAAQALAIPTEKRGRLLILEDAVRALAAAWRQRT